MDSATPADSKAVSVGEYVREVAAAAKRLALYPPGHPTARMAAERPFGMLCRLWGEKSNVVVSLSNGKLVADGVPLDERLASDGLGRVMRESGLQSITFTQGLTSAQFETFLGYLNLKSPEQDLSGFLGDQGINKIAVDRWHYELVGEDDKVVSADSVEAQAGETLEFRKTLSEMLREQPGTVMRLLAGQPTSGDSVGVVEERGSGTGASIETGSANSAAVDAAAVALPSDRHPLLQGLESLPDDELLRLLAAGLKESLAVAENPSGVDFGRVLFSLKDFLATRADADLVPRLRQTLQESGIIDDKYVDMILADDVSPQSIAATELDGFLASFAQGEPAPEKLAELLTWLEMAHSDEQDVKLVQELFSRLEERSFQLTGRQQQTLSRFAEHTSGKPLGDLAQAHFDEICRRISKPDLGREEFEVLAGHIDPLYTAATEHDLFDRATCLLREVNRIANIRDESAVDLTKLAGKLQQQLSCSDLAEKLVVRMQREFAGKSKPITQLLEQFSGFEAGLVFADHIDDAERGVRVLMIRLLSQLGESGLQAVRLMLSDKSLFARPPSEPALATESWYKLRNLILVLSNIPHQESLDLLKPLVEDKDERLVLEALSALEKLGGPEVAGIAARLLNYPSQQVQSRALRLISGSEEPRIFPAVASHFIRRASERATALSVLESLDRTQTIDFLTSVLEGTSEIFAKYANKPDESLNEMIVNTFIKWRLRETDSVLQRYVKSPAKSVLGHFRKPTSVKLAERYLNSLAKQA